MTSSTIINTHWILYIVFLKNTINCILFRSLTRLKYNKKKRWCLMEDNEKKHGLLNEIKTSQGLSRISILRANFGSGFMYFKF